jgi:hypothetical protein
LFNREPAAQLVHPIGQKTVDSNGKKFGKNSKYHREVKAQSD